MASGRERGHDGRLRTVGGHHRPPGPAGPTSQAVERHSTTIAASAGQVWAAPAQVTVGELRLFRLVPGRPVASPATGG